MHGEPGVQPSETFAPGRVVASRTGAFIAGEFGGVKTGNGAVVDVAGGGSGVTTGTAEAVVEGVTGAGTTGVRTAADDDEDDEEDDDDDNVGVVKSVAAGVLSTRAGVSGLATGWGLTSGAFVVVVDTVEVADGIAAPAGTHTVVKTETVSMTSLVTVYQTMSRFTTGAAVATARSEERAMILKDFIFINECKISGLRRWIFRRC